MKQVGFFDFEEALLGLTKAGDRLEGLAKAVDFELFRRKLEKALRYSDRARGGRPPFDPVMMFKVLVLQALYGLSDERAEFMIRDRLSFKRFLGLGLGDMVPDEKTIWLFRERLTRKRVIGKLFERFDLYLEEQGLLALGGQIVDATLVEAKRPRHGGKEREAIGSGEAPPEKADHEAKLRQQDKDGRWVLKRGRKRRDKVQLMVPAFGYKSHISIDRRHGLIRRWSVTHAASYDGAQLEELLQPRNLASRVWADTAYRSRKNEAMLERHGKVSMIHFRRQGGKVLTHQRKRANRSRSVVRSKVEHVFAQQKARMGLFIRTVGLDRARTKIAMANLAYNMRRFMWLERQVVPS